MSFAVNFEKFFRTPFVQKTPSDCFCHNYPYEIFYQMSKFHTLDGSQVKTKIIFQYDG